MPGEVVKDLKPLLGIFGLDPLCSDQGRGEIAASANGLTGSAIFACRVSGLGSGRVSTWYFKQSRRWLSLSCRRGDGIC